MSSMPSRLLPAWRLQGAGYLAQVEERYVSDAYNSLSIEGYRVTDELIERVARGDWNPDGEPEHDKTRNALAARGYFQAFQAVKASIGKVLAKENAGLVVKRDHHDWYAELFGPSVTAGIVEAISLPDIGAALSSSAIRCTRRSPAKRSWIRWKRCGT
jgi:hypothetical protein